MNVSHKRILVNKGGSLQFNEKEIAEYILDADMKLKAVRFMDGRVEDLTEIHRRHSPQHPLLKTPQGLKTALDQFFLHSISEKRLQAPY
ncbi:hypothetical protein ACFLRF_03145 [Candidatus Altiarchaeota archaeon]